MTQPLQPRRQGRAITKLNRLVLMTGGGVLCLFVGGVMLLRASLKPSVPVVAPETPQEQHLKLPDAITRELPKREPVVTPVIVQEPPVVVAPAPPAAVTTVAPPALPPIQQSILDTINPLRSGGAPQKSPSSKSAPPVQREASTPPAPEKPKKGWNFLAKGERDATPKAPVVPVVAKEEGEREESFRAGGSDLIHPARWAMPQEPLKTVYRSQTLTGRLLQAINSDIPGQVKIQLTTPILDKFGYDTTIIPKDSIIIAMQEGATHYGTTRIPLRLEQIEFPSGEVVDLKAAIGDQDGANGLTGKVNNHIGKLLLATGISAILNIGTQVATGTPDGFYANPAQQAARDIGAKVQRDTESIVDRQLRRPPTITIPAGTFCTVNLAENVQFHRPPAVAR